MVVVARSLGIDLISGEGLDEALTAVQTIVDVTNTSETTAAARAYFETATGNLLAAEHRAGVGHHVALSIRRRRPGRGQRHYAGKRGQEHVVEAGPVPATVLRATQFHDFAAMVAGWTRQGDVATSRWR